ncbi:MAG TPA: family 10 glycosylhydrolase, partial [Sumerlaeia bacterium]|nr:family 10 glycosylhydrolase [Sumerlaeia bacterium]
AEKYDVDGVHFDYIRYPGEVGETCFCAGCKERFEKFIGAKIEKWPDIVHDDAGVEQQWYEFRRQQITKVVATVAERVRAVKPNVKVSAAVFRNWPSDRDRIGQDWKVWCDKGYLDFVCPMDYTPDNDVFEEMLSRQLPWVGDVPCYPGIGMGVWPDPDDITKLVEQIKITRRLGADGFTIFNYEGESAVDHMIPMCGKGITRKE